MSSRHRLSRLFSVAALTVAGALALSACAGGGDGASDAVELDWAIGGANLANGHMDPQTSQLDVSAMVQRQVLDSLVFQNADGSFSPWLAKSWDISADGLTYTFTLRDDVTFTDGEKFDAAAVKANFDRIIDPDTASAQAASMLGGENYAGTEVVDDHTVTVTFAKPYAPFLQAASTANLGFYSPKALAEHGDELKAGGPDISVGTGPFILTSYTPDQEIVYTRNADYAWGPQGQSAPKIDTLRVQIVPEPSVRVGMLSTGESQVATELPPSAVVDVATEDSVQVQNSPGLPYSLYLNERNGVFADEKVRQAFQLGADLSTTVDAVFDGQYERAWSILGPSSPYYDAALDGSGAYDPDAANALLDAAGWTARDAEGFRTKDGTRLSARWIAWTPVSDDNAALANAIQSDLKKIGFEVTRDVLEPAAYNEQYGPRTFDLTDWGYSGADPDLLRNHLGTDGFQNASVVSDPQVDAWLDAGATSSDTSERVAAYTSVQQWNADHVAIVPVYVPAVITATTPAVTGVTYDLDGRPLFYDATVL